MFKGFLRESNVLSGTEKGTEGGVGGFPGEIVYKRKGEMEGQLERNDREHNIQTTHITNPPSRVRFVRPLLLIALLLAARSQGCTL